MKRLLPTLAALSALIQTAFAVDLTENAWLDYQVVKINKESPSAAMKVFGKASDAEKPVSIADVDKIHEGDRYKLLNGQWKFFFADTPKEVKKEFFAENFDDSKWKFIKVPNSWQSEGYDTIFYNNTTLEFMYDKKGNMLPDFVNGPSMFKRNVYAPVVKKFYIPEGHKQSGIYRRTFTVPADWKGENVFIRFDGVRTGFRFFVNGKFIGYSEDSFTPAEFNITDYIKRGAENTLAVQVYKYSTGAYNEMQDMPHVMGIIRDVFLLARPDVYVKDYHAPAELSADLDSATIDLTITLRNLSDKPQNGVDVEAYLLDEDGKIFRKSFWSAPLLEESANVKPRSLAEINKKIDVSGFKLWSPDKPNFYTLCIKLSKDGKELETVRADFGFRKFKIVNRHLELNNKKMLIKGVNRHDWSPKTGKAVSFDEMKQDVELMKRANVNFVRASHYPNDDRFYMLCNRYGLAVLDENNHEQHAFLRNPAINLPNHVPQMVDRAENMVFRDRNIPSIMIFSVGNESSLLYTLGHKATEQVVRKNSPQHYFMSHGETYDIINGAPNGTSDFVTPMYRDITQMERYLEMETQKPFFHAEYAHAMGNSIGNLEGMWKFLRKHEGTNGGFIWDWVDQSFYLPCENDKTKKYLSDGRDWNTIPTQQNFCCNGIIFADRTVSAKYFEVQKVYQPFFIEQLGKCPLKITITNDLISSDLDEYTPEVSVARNGRVVAKKTLRPMSLEAGKTKTFEIELPEFDASEAGEYFYTLAFKYSHKLPYAEKGEVAAQQQFFLKKVADKEYAARGEISVSEPAAKVVVKAGKAEIVFNAVRNAEFVSYKFDGKDVIVSPVVFDFKGAGTDNQRRIFANEIRRYKLDKLVNVDSSLRIQKLGENGKVDAVRITCENVLNNGADAGFKTSFVYTILPDGSMQVSSQLVKLNKMPRYLMVARFGLRMGVNKKFDSVEYFGKGPFANYIDRAAAANVGLYSSKVADWFEPFTYTQDTGNREQVRWLALSDGKQGVLFSAQTPLAMAVLPNTQEEIANAKHPYLLPESSATDLRISAKVPGLGNASCGLPARDEFRIDFKGSLEWKFNIRPVENMADVEKMGAELFPKKFDFSFKHFDKNQKFDLKKFDSILNSADKPAKKGIGEGSAY